jgi:hypothetical protein
VSGSKTQSVSLAHPQKGSWARQSAELV